VLVLGERLAPPYEQTRAVEREILAAAGAELVIADSLDEWRELAPRADGVVHQSVKIRAEELALLERCRCIAHNAVGVDMIDTAEAARLGIVVANVPRYGSDDVADQAFTLILACARKLQEQIAIGGKSEGWGVFPLVPIYRLRGRTLGVIGAGNIGRESIARGLGFGLTVLVYDPYVAPERIAELGAQSVLLSELLARAHILTVHTPLTPETRGLIGADELAQLQPGAIVVNVARGPIIDEVALAAALESGHIAAAGLDVFAIEPLPADAAIRKAPRTIITPHAAYYSQSSIESMQTDPAREVAATLRGFVPPHAAILPGIDWGHAYQRWNLLPNAG
jgi:D-3-phosphoglycerate dehydrogenase